MLSGVLDKQVTRLLHHIEETISYDVVNQAGNFVFEQIKNCGSQNVLKKVLDADTCQLFNRPHGRVEHELFLGLGILVVRWHKADIAFVEQFIPTHNNVWR